MIASSAFLWTVLLAFAVPGDPTADAVLGQTDFASTVTNAPDGNTSPANLSLTNAPHLAVAPSGRLYVSDPGNNRVLSWPDAAAFATGASADMVIGQPDFVSNSPNYNGVTASSLSLPQGVWVDAGGNLWVADAFNSRVLKFNNPLTDATPGVADLVIGQPDFVHNDQNLAHGDHGTNVASQDSLQFPGRVLLRGTEVYIADSGNSRVLHYSSVTGNKPFADRVFGQLNDFTCRAKNNDGLCNNGCCATIDNLYNPIGITVDAAGRLYIADWINNRILRYDNPLTSSTPNAVYGQADFVSGGSNAGGTSSGLDLPIDLATDAAGRLIVADSGNNRVVVYSSPLTIATRSAVFGQLGSFTATDVNHGLGFFTSDADGLFGPTGVTVDGHANLLIADTNNNRVLRFDQPFVHRGDMNCDAVVNLADIAPFAEALVNPAAFALTGCDASNGDINGDGRLDGRDVAAFATLLTGM